jgi:prolyl 4-hydroxylase
MNSFLNRSIVFGPQRKHETLNVKLNTAEFSTMYKSWDLGPKDAFINPPHYLPTFAGNWSVNNVKIEKVDVSKWEGSDKFCVVLHNILSMEECQHLITLAERNGFHGGAKPATYTGVKPGDRSSCEDFHITEQVWQRIVKAAERDKNMQSELVHIPWINERCRLSHSSKSFRAVGMNEQMRFHRYDSGQSGAPQVDSSFVRSTEAGIDRYGEQSFISFQLYLNDGFKGGATRFISEYGAHNDMSAHDWDGSRSGNSSPRKSLGHKIVPHAGSVVLFQHDCCHEEMRVEAGRKYIMRSDIMYSTAGPGAEYAHRPIIARQFDDLY